MTRAGAPATLALLCLALAGCGSSPGDILGLGMSGGPLRTPLRMHVMEDGRAACNAKPLHQLPSALVLEARNIVREAKPLTKHDTRFPATAPGRRTFELRTPDGTVDWGDGAPGVPTVLSQAEQLALQLEQRLC